MSQFHALLRLEGVEVRTTKDGQRGLFATRDLAHDMLVLVEQVMVEPVQVLARILKHDAALCTGLWPRAEQNADDTNEQIAHKIAHNALAADSNGSALLAPATAAVNHSCDPSLLIVTYVCGSADTLGLRLVGLLTRRAVAKDEELTLHYGASVHSDSLSEKGLFAHPFQCQCGASVDEVRSKINAIKSETVRLLKRGVNDLISASALIHVASGRAGRVSTAHMLAKSGCVAIDDQLICTAEFVRQANKAINGKIRDDAVNELTAYIHTACEREFSESIVPRIKSEARSHYARCARLELV